MELQKKLCFAELFLLSFHAYGWRTECKRLLSDGGLDRTGVRKNYETVSGGHRAVRVFGSMDCSNLAEFSKIPVQIGRCYICSGPGEFDLGSGPERKQLIESEKFCRLQTLFRKIPWQWGVCTTSIIARVARLRWLRGRHCLARIGGPGGSQEELTA